MKKGIKAKRNGEHFENLVERSCIHYSKKGLAEIKKTPEPMRPIQAINRQRGLYKAIFSKKAQPDFTGTLKNGQSVMFEAKHTDSTNLPFARLNAVQESDLNAHAELGASCFVLISFEMKHFYAVPWSKWMHLKKNIGKKSVNQKDLVDFEISHRNGLLNFLRIGD